MPQKTPREETSEEVIARLGEKLKVAQLENHALREKADRLLKQVAHKARGRTLTRGGNSGKVDDCHTGNPGFLSAELPQGLDEPENAASRIAYCH